MLALLLALLSAAVLFVIAAPRAARAQVSEKEVQGIEEQEFGIEGGKKQKQQPAEPKAEKPPEDYQSGAEPEKVKSIEAEEFRVKILKKSHNGRVLMIEDASENRPRPGKILLLKSSTDDIAAVRVLKNYPGKFAAKIVLPINRYDFNTEYRAIKKLGDKIVALIKEREKRGKDLDQAKTDEDLAKEVSPDDNELDRGIPTPKPKATKKVSTKPEGAPGPLSDSSGPPKPEPLFTKDGQEINNPDSIEVKDEDEPYADVSVQEELPIEQHRHAFSIEYGALRNVDKDNNPATYSGFGARYAFNIWRMPFWKRRSFQDMFSLEAAMFYYTISNFLTTSDSVTVYPMIFSLRYTLFIGETFSVFGYLGVEKNSVSQADNSLSTGTAVLATTHSVMGIGAMLGIGPSWAVRLDVGNDLFGLGAVLKF